MQFFHDLPVYGGTPAPGRRPDSREHKQEGTIDGLTDTAQRGGCGIEIPEGGDNTVRIRLERTGKPQKPAWICNVAGIAEYNDFRLRLQVMNPRNQVMVLLTAGRGAATENFFGIAVKSTESIDCGISRIVLAFQDEQHPVIGMALCEKCRQNRFLIRSVYLMKTVMTEFFAMVKNSAIMENALLDMFPVIRNRYAWNKIMNAGMFKRYRLSA